MLLLVSNQRTWDKKSIVIPLRGSYRQVFLSSLNLDQRESQRSVFRGTSVAQMLGLNINRGTSIFQ